MKNFNTCYNCFSWSYDRQGELCVKIGGTVAG